MTPSILLVDDEPALRYGFTKYLTKAGFHVQEATTLAEARRAVLGERLDAVLLDMNLPDGNGLDWIRELREQHPEVPIVVISGVGDIPMAVEAMRRGADHFLTKPVNMSDLEVFLQKSLELGSLRRRNLAHRRLSHTQDVFLGESPAIKETINHLKLAANNDSTVLLHGETGTGKGVFARWIYQHGQRASMPFVEVNCSALRGDLLSNELFGHVRGAFTTAVETRQGLLDVADGGTLFLDEIGDMELSVQSQFLKVLEERRYRRLGDVQERRSEFRLICATNRDLLEETQNGRFRKDLYFRINVIPIDVPPLRTRLEDLPGLIKNILAALARPNMDVSPKAIETLSEYSWPGNIRELRNVVERGLMLAAGESSLTPRHFPGLDAHRLVANKSGDPERSAETDRIRDVLRGVDGDTKKAAELLGISRATLYRRLKPKTGGI